MTAQRSGGTRSCMEPLKVPEGLTFKNTFFDLSTGDASDSGPEPATCPLPTEGWWPTTNQKSSPRGKFAEMLQVELDGGEGVIRRSPSPGPVGRLPSGSPVPTPDWFGATPNLFDNAAQTDRSCGHFAQLLFAATDGNDAEEPQSTSTSPRLLFGATPVPALPDVPPAPVAAPAVAPVTAPPPVLTTAPPPPLPSQCGVQSPPRYSHAVTSTAPPYLPTGDATRHHLPMPMTGGVDQSPVVVDLVRELGLGGSGLFVLPQSPATTKPRRRRGGKDSKDPQRSADDPFDSLPTAARIDLSMLVRA